MVRLLLSVALSDMRTNYYKIYIGNKDKYNYIQMIQLGGKQRNESIVEFIKNSSIEKIKKDLVNKLENNVMCDKIIGQGFVGSVVISSVGSTYELEIGNKIIKIPIIIKTTQMDNEIDINVIDGELFISTYRNISIEAIILSYIREIWNNGVSPHLPLLIGYSKCSDRSKSPIDKIVIERAGLPEEISVKIPGLYDEPMWNEYIKVDIKKPMFRSTLATLGDLLFYISLSKKGDTVVLPNSRECNIIDLCNYLTISYLKTDELLRKHNITLTDMHSGNIFIHWLNENSHMGDNNISNTEYIYYKHRDKYLKIQTFGLLLKLGDTGSFIVNPKSHVYIAGHAANILTTYNIVKNVSKMQTCQIFLYNLKYALTTELFKKTIAYEIISDYPYNDIHWLYVSHKHLKDLLTPVQMLDYFKQYVVDKPIKSKNTLIVK